MNNLSRKEFSLVRKKVRAYAKSALSLHAFGENPQLLKKKRMQVFPILIIVISRETFRFHRASVDLPVRVIYIVLVYVKLSQSVYRVFVRHKTTHVKLDRYFSQGRLTQKNTSFFDLTIV